jgi:cystathionine beta-lyase/cystathionine gamma-synthase
MFADDRYAASLYARLDALSAGGEEEEAALVSSVAFPLENADFAAAAFARGNAPVEERLANQAPMPPIYGRWANPTTDALEARLAHLEGAEAALVTASGMAAISGTCLTFLAAGDHVVAPRSLYAETARLFRERLPRLGITTTFIDDVTPASYAAAITDQTRALYLETPSNPLLRVTDVAAVVAIAKERNLLTFADGTFATPFAQSLVAAGVDVTLHSLTKGLGGHGDAIGGVCLGARKLLLPLRDTVTKGLGSVLAPDAAQRILRGLRTFPLRQFRANLTAARIARLLAARDDVRVHHPSLPTHPDHSIAARTMHAFGTVVSFEILDAGEGARARGRIFLDALQVFTRAVSLGDTASLAIHPASTTHASMPAADRLRAGIGDGLVRLSIGLESAESLGADLTQALEKARLPARF